MKKRWMSLVLAVSLAVSVTGCQGGGKTESETQGQETVADESQTQKKVDASLKVGEQLSGFTLKDVGTYEPVGAETYHFYHEASGAELLCIKNDDSNLGFTITYRTPVVDETDTNHVFEHAVLASSDKYPSKNLIFAMISKTYSTFINAFTYTSFTSYPLCSQSQEQLEKMVDANLSCMVAPTLLKDERYFKREAVRYELRDMEDPITISGTVYSEDFGMLTDISAEAGRNVKQALYPKEFAANAIGRAHINYQGLTYEHAKETYDRCYSFDNSLILLYGDMDYAAFLEFLDQEYLAKAERGNKDLSQYKDGKTEAGYVEETVYSPAYEGDSTEHASLISYAMDISEDTWEQLCQYEIISEMLSGDSSILNQNLRAAGITEPAYAVVALEAKPFFQFMLENTDEENAQTFKAVVDQTMEEISQFGMEQGLVDTVLKGREIDAYMELENPYVFADLLISDVSNKWALHGETDALEDKQRALQTLKEDKNQTLIRQFGERFLNAERKALVTTVPKAGIAEEIEQAQVDYLAELKASMTKEELEQMIENTLAFDEWNASESEDEGFTINVESLPDPDPFVEVKETKLDGITSYTSANGLKEISSNRIYLDVSGVKQEDLHYITLYTMLSGMLGTERYEKAEKDKLMQQYLYNLSFDSTYPYEKAGENHRPMLAISWYGLTEDYKKSLELLVEILGHTDLTDEEEIKRVLDVNLPLLDPSQADELDQAIELAAAALSSSYQYTNYMNGWAFYQFAKEVREKLETDPSYFEVLQEKLQSVRDLILRKDNLIVLNTAPKEDLAEMEAISQEVLGSLPSLEIEREAYNLPKLKRHQAVIMESSSQTSVKFYGLDAQEDFAGKYFPFMMATNDCYIIPKLRYQGGVYTAVFGTSYDLTKMYFYSYRDLNVGKTLDILKGDADYLKSMELTQEDLDGYILKAYGLATESGGKMNRNMRAMYYRMIGFDTDEYLKKVAQIREAKVEDQAAAAEALAKLSENAAYVTTGNQKQILADQDYFESIEDYRQGN